MRNALIVAGVLVVLGLIALGLNSGLGVFAQAVGGVPTPVPTSTPTNPNPDNEIVRQVTIGGVGDCALLDFRAFGWSGWKLQYTYFPDNLLNPAPDGYFRLYSKGSAVPSESHPLVEGKGVLLGSAGPGQATINLDVPPGNVYTLSVESRGGHWSITRFPPESMITGPGRTDRTLSDILPGDPRRRSLCNGTPSFS